MKQESVIVNYTCIKRSSFILCKIIKMILISLNSFSPLYYIHHQQTLSSHEIFGNNPLKSIHIYLTKIFSAFTFLFQLQNSLSKPQNSLRLLNRELHKLALAITITIVSC